MARSMASDSYRLRGRSRPGARARAKAAADRTSRTRAAEKARVSSHARVPAVPSSGTGGAAAPQSYEDFLRTGDGIYQSDQANLKAQDISDAAKRDAAIKALKFRYNDPNNPFSEVAQLDRARGFARGDMTANRTARGVLASGGTKLAEQNIGYDYSKQLYDAQNQMNAQIGSLDQNYADSSYQRIIQSQQDLKDAQQRYIDAGLSPAAAAGMVAAGGKGPPSPKGGVPGAWNGGPGDAAARSSASQAAIGPQPTSQYFAGPGFQTIHSAPGSENSLYAKSLAQRTTADAMGRVPGQRGYGMGVASGGTAPSRGPSTGVFSLGTYGA